MAENRQNSDETQSYVVLIKGTMVDHYRIIEKIGAGGMGEVYLAQDTELDRKVALKFLPPHLCQDEDCRKRFKREAQAAAKLDHSNIVTVHEVGEFHQRPYFVMQHVEGPSLKDVIKEAKLPIERVIELSLQICGGLREAHEADIVHRDIKPTNILIDSKGQPKLVDFGLAAIMGTTKITKTGSTLGTVGYMSPEQAEGKEVDQRSDLFSLGVVLYEMITGKRPFDRESDVATSKAIVTDTPEPLARYKARVPGELQQIVDRALEKDVEARYPSAAAMLVDLKRLAATEREKVPAWKNVRRLRWAAAISLVIIVAVWGGLQLKERLSPAEAQAKSLAVVDFDNIGAEDDAYLASGLAEDLAIKLRQLDGFRVASSADIRRLAKENLLPREVAARLKVQYALGGSLLREDTLVRVNVELIEKETGDVVWSDQINMQFTEIFQFLDEVSLNIAQALEVRLTPVEEAAMAAKSTDNTGAYDHYLRGRHYYYNLAFRDNELAEREFERALQRDPDYPLALAGLADTYVQRYKEAYDHDEYWLDSADVLVAKALELDPDLAEAHESRAEALLQKDHITGALEAAEKARSLRPDWDEPYVHLGNIYRGRGERSKALAMFDTALSLRLSVDALCGKGDVFQTRGFMDSAKVAFEAASELNPYHDYPYLELGWLYEELSQGEKAEALFRRAIEVRPDRADGYLELSDKLLERGRVQEGEELLRGFVNRYPYNWDGYSHLYYYLAYVRADYTAAFQVIEEAVRNNPERAWPHLLLAYSFAERMSPESRSGETLPASEKAVQAVDRALALRPNSGRVLEWAGRVYVSLNRRDEAIHYFNRALEARSGSIDLPDRIAWFLVRVGEYERALEFGLTALKNSPKNSWYYFSLGIILENLNRSHEYLEILEKAAAEYEDDPIFLQLLCAEQRLAGQLEEAIKTSERALAIKRTSFWGWKLGITLWLSGDTEAALDGLKEEKKSYSSAYWIVAILKSEDRLHEIEEYLNSIKEETPMHVSGIDHWAEVASSYYMSMRRYDDALAVFSEYRESGNETFALSNTMAMVLCYRQKGLIDSARHTLQELTVSASGDKLPYVFMDLALLEAVGAEDLAAALELAERAVTELSIPGDWVKEPLARLLYASGRMEEAAETLERIRSTFYDPCAAAHYRRAQMAAVTRSRDPEMYLDYAIARLTRMTRGYWRPIEDASTFLGLALARAGRPDEARQEIKRALKLEPEREDVAYHAACAYSLIGDTTLALQWLETAVDRGYLELWWARVDPDLDPLRDLPRFKEIMNDWDSRIQALLEESG